MWTKYLVVSALIFSLASCSGRKGSTQSTPTGIRIESIIHQNSTELVVRGQGLSRTNDLRMTAHSSAIYFDLQTVTDEEIVARLRSGSRFSVGIWKLFLSTAVAEEQFIVNLQVEDASVTDSKISSVSASKVNGVFNLNQIPDLATLYAKLDAGKIPLALFPDLSATYSLAAHTHTPSQLSAVSESTGTADAGKLVKLNSVGAISSSSLASDLYKKHLLPIRSTRSTINATATGAAKDAACASEYGSDYVAAVSQEAMIYLNVATKVCMAVRDYTSPARGEPGTVSSMEYSVVLTTGVCSTPIARLACIYKNAQWRVTRSNVNSDATDAGKDAACANDLGPAYKAGTLEDFSFIPSQPHNFGYLGFAGQTLASRFSREPGTSVTVATDSGVTPTKILCVRNE